MIIVSFDFYISFLLVNSEVLLCFCDCYSVIYGFCVFILCSLFSFIVYDRFIYNFVWHEGKRCARFLFFNSWLFILLLLVEILARPESLGSYFLHFHIMVLLYPYLQDFGWVINGFIESELPERGGHLR